MKFGYNLSSNLEKVICNCGWRDGRTTHGQTTDPAFGSGELKMGLILNWAGKQQELFEFPMDNVPKLLDYKTSIKCSERSRNESNTDRS